MKVAIAGYAAEGKVNYRYWRELGHQVTIVDERELSAHELPYGASSMLGEGILQELEDFDLVVRTASLNPQKIKTDGKIWSATNEFFEKCPAEIIGVTGTKGKGTTCSLIASIFEAAGRTVHLVGNIGTPALEVLPSIAADDIVVFELSSFQLWDIERSPHTAVVLLIEPDHLNIHRDMDDYVGAKANIRTHQQDGDTCIYHPTNALAMKVAHASKQGEALRYGVSDDGGVYESEGYFCQNEQKICSTNALQLLGRHNIENACAAITVAKRYDLTDEAIGKGLKNFTGLPHRLEYVRTLDGVKYYNDSFSSAPSAAAAAVSSFTQPEILILGGTDKGADFTNLITEIKNSQNIKRILLIGEIRHKLDELFGKAGVGSAQVLDAGTMEDIVATARREAAEGDVVILSPACASFDMFRDFYDRGDQFRSIVQSL